MSEVLTEKANRFHEAKHYCAWNIPLLSKDNMTLEPVDRMAVPGNEGRQARCLVQSSAQCRSCSQCSSVALVSETARRGFVVPATIKVPPHASCAGGGWYNSLAQWRNPDGRGRGPARGWPGPVQRRVARPHSRGVGRRQRRGPYRGVPSVHPPVAVQPPPRPAGGGAPPAGGLDSRH
jgi:hypothetical protein